MKREQAFIKLDFDNCEKVDYDTVRRRIERAGYKSIEKIHSSKSPSGKGWHLILEVFPRPKCAFEVVALQAICGSDPYREAMQMNRARNFSSAPKWMRDAWNVLYSSHPLRKRHVNLREE